MNTRGWMFVVAVALSAASQAALYNLSADYSGTSNPSGLWSYRAGTTLLTSTTTWPGDLWGTPQQGWVGNFTPFFFKSNGTEQFTHDWSAGTLVVHSSNPGQPDFNAIWTAPMTGSANLSGFAWEGRDIGRGNDWLVLKNSAPLTMGHVQSGDPYHSGNPFNFANGSGGSAALSNVVISAGDTLAVRIVQTSAVGDYVGFDFTVDFTPVPEPASLTAIAAGVFALLTKRRRT